MPMQRRPPVRRTPPEPPSARPGPTRPVHRAARAKITTPVTQPIDPEQAPSCPCRAPVTGRPLPDLTGVRLAPVPDPSPPYDDQLPAGPFARPEEQSGPGPLPFTARSPQASAAHGNDQPQEPAPGGAPTGSPANRSGTRGGAEPAEPGEWPSRFAQVLAETLAGSRPASQIEPWTTERARANIRRLGPLLAAGQRPRVQRVLTSYPADDVVEVAAIVGFGPRTRALAARLERARPQPATPGRPGRDARWLCTAVESA